MEIAHPVQSPPHSLIIYSTIIIKYYETNYIYNIIVICVRYHNRKKLSFRVHVEKDAYDTLVQMMRI